MFVASAKWTSGLSSLTPRQSERTTQLTFSHSDNCIWSQPHCPGKGIYVNITLLEGKILNSAEKLVSHFWRSAYNSFDLDGPARRALSFQQGTTCPKNPLVQQTNKNMLGSTHSTFFFFFFYLLDPSSPTKDQTCAPPSALEAWSLNPWTAREVRGSTHSRGTSSALKTTFILCTCSVAQSCPTLCDPMDCSPQGSSVHGISQARILEWTANSYSRGSSWPRDWIQVSCTDRRVFVFFLTTEPPGKPSCYPKLTYYYLLWPHLPQIFYHTATWVTFPEIIPTKLFLIKFFTGFSYNFDNQFMIGFHLRLQPQLLGLSHGCFFTSTLQNESKMLKHTFCHISLQTLFFCLVFSSSSWFL